MDQVVIGLENEATARASVRWAIERALIEPVHLRLVAELDPGGSNPGSAKQTLANASRDIQALAPGTEVEFVLADRALLRELLMQSESADLVVIGSHPDARIRDGSTPSLPVSTAARSQCPVVIVPDDWTPHGGPIVVGVDAAGAAYEAARFAAREAIAAQRELVVVLSWQPWEAQHTRAEQIRTEAALADIVERIGAEFPTARVRGELTEAVAHDGLIANSRDAHLVVLGTFGIGRESGVVLGTIHQEVMIRGRVALCVVPLAETQAGVSS